MQLPALADLIKHSRHATVLTGAGISTSAGIPDFRGASGLYTTRRYDPERTFDIQWFDRDPTVFYAFARDFLNLLSHVEPTETHRILAQLERQRLLATVITQNIDGLHQKAGSEHVIELHGGFRHAHCRDCGQGYKLEELEQSILAGKIPRCRSCSGVIKPDIVFYGESVLGMDEAIARIRQASLLLVVGTSLTVYPAAMLPRLCSGTVVCIGYGTRDISVSETEYIEEDIDAVFAELERLLMRIS